MLGLSLFASRLAETYARVDEIPEVLRAPGRMLSVRAYDSNDMLAGAAVIGTAEIDQ